MVYVEEEVAEDLEATLGQMGDLIGIDAANSSHWYSMVRHD